MIAKAIAGKVGLAATVPLGQIPVVAVQRHGYHPFGHGCVGVRVNEVCVCNDLQSTTCISCCLAAHQKVQHISNLMFQHTHADFCWKAERYVAHVLYSCKPAGSISRPVRHAALLM